MRNDVLKLVAFEYNSDIFRHSRGDGSLLIGFDGEGCFFGWKNGDTLGNRSLINNFDGGSI
jgi:hypothetical protein